MIIPVVFSLAPIRDNLGYTWVFHKGIDIAKRYKWPVFAQRQYFREWDKQEQLGDMNPILPEWFDYEPISKADYEQVIQVEFPQNCINTYVNRFPSQTDAYLASVRQPWPEMAAFMVEHVRQCEKITGEKAEAFMGVHLPRFVWDAAKMLGIEAIEYEWGPFRKPDYRITAFMDLKCNICEGEMLERYEAFKSVKDRLPILEKKEILALFLTKQQLYRLTEPDVIPEYKLGIAGGYGTLVDYNAYSMISLTELIVQAHHYFSDSQICVRYHPSDPINARVRGLKQDNGDLIDFIQKSERVACMFSNIAYEAMLWNRPSYDYGVSMYGRIGNHKLDGLPDNIPSDDFLSFVAFGYLIPFEFLKNVEYIKWRLSRPSEEEIYLYHLDYYLSCIGMSRDILRLQGKERLERIVQIRSSNLLWRSIDDIQWKDVSDLSRAYVKNERLKCAMEQVKEQAVEIEAQLEKAKCRIQVLEDELKNANQQVQGLQNELGNAYQQTQEAQQENRALRSTLSWKVTKPLRATKQFLKLILSNLVVCKRE